MEYTKPYFLCILVNHLNEFFSLLFVSFLRQSSRVVEVNFLIIPCLHCHWCCHLFDFRISWLVYIPATFFIVISKTSSSCLRRETKDHLFQKSLCLLCCRNINSYWWNSMFFSKAICFLCCSNGCFSYLFPKSICNFILYFFNLLRCLWNNNITLWISRKLNTSGLRVLNSSLNGKSFLLSMFPS